MPARAAAARVAWLVTRDPQDPQRRLLTVAKNNIGQDLHAYAYRLEGQRVRWESKPLDMSGDAVLADAGAVRRLQNFVREKLAAAFVADYLQTGPRSWTVIERAGRIAGYKPGMLERVRAGVAETYRQTGPKGRWFWRLIGDTRENAIQTHDETLIT